MNFLLLTKSLVLGARMPVATLDANRARLGLQHDEISHQMHVLKAEKKAANVEAVQAWEALTAARARCKEIDRQRELALRELERVSGGIMLLKTLQVKPRRTK